MQIYDLFPNSGQYILLCTLLRWWWWCLSSCSLNSVFVSCFYSSSMCDYFLYLIKDRRYIYSVFIKENVSVSWACHWEWWQQHRRTRVQFFNICDPLYKNTPQGPKKKNFFFEFLGQLNPILRDGILFFLVLRVCFHRAGHIFMPLLMRKIAFVFRIWLYFCWGNFLGMFPHGWLLYE